MAVITRHAKRRMHERAGVTRGIADQFVLKVLRDGIKHEDAKGELSEWMNREYFRYRTANNMRYYAGKLYIFTGEKLITVLNASPEMETNLPQLVEATAYEHYRKSRIRKELKKKTKDALDERQRMEEEIMIALQICVERNHFPIAIMSVRHIKPHVIRISYIADSTVNDWWKYSYLQDYVKEYFGVGAYLTKVKDREGRYVSLQEWNGIKQTR